MKNVNIKKPNVLKLNSKISALILSILLTFLSAPGLASAENISTNERNQFQPVVPFDASMMEREAQVVVMPVRPIASFSHNENPLSVAGPVPDPQKALSVAGYTEDLNADYAKLSEADRQGYDTFLDELFVKAYQDSAAQEGIKNIQAKDPVRFMLDYMADAGNAKRLITYAEFLASDPQMSEGLQGYVQNFLSSLSSSDEQECAKNIEKAYEKRLFRFEGDYGGSLMSESAAGGALPAPAGHDASYMGWIRDRIQQAHENLQEPALAKPFAQEPILRELTKELRATETAAVTRTVAPGQYQTVDSVFISKDFIRTQKMANAPEEMYPYVQWVVYGRHLTPENLSRYVKIREKVLELYKRAKEGNGKIRYKGRVYEAFLPKTFESSGNFELIQPIKG